MSMSLKIKKIKIKNKKRIPFQNASLTCIFITQPQKIYLKFFKKLI